MSKHTLGPWEEHYNSWEVSSVYDAEGRCVAECHIFDGGLLNDETQDEFEEIKDANARLIASAPDLLNIALDVREACLFVHDDGQVGVSEDVVISSELFDRLCAAINKAEGRS